MRWIVVKFTRCAACGAWAKRRYFELERNGDMTWDNESYCSIACRRAHPPSKVARPNPEEVE